MRVLVTGGSGYIGSRLLAALGAEAGVEEVAVVDIRDPRETAGGKVRFVKRSVTEDLTDLFTDPKRPVDVAMHLAWTVDPLRDPARQRAICVGGSRHFLEGCAAGRVKHVFFMSSGTAYGANPAHAEPVSEFEPLKDRWHFQYSAEKREVEGLFRRFAEDRPGTLLQIARPSVVGGPNVSNFIFRAIDRTVAFLARGHDPNVQLVHEDDVAGALVAILKSRVPGAFNVAGDGLLRMSQAYDELGARKLVLPVPALLAAASLAWRFDMRSITEAPSDFVWFIIYPWLLSNRRLKQEVGFIPRHTTQGVVESYKAARAAARAVAAAPAAKTATDASPA